MADYQETLKGKYPAKGHAKRVADYITEHGGDRSGVIYLEGQKTRMIEVSLLVQAQCKLPDGLR